jgi:hypothetical protein
MSKTLFPIASEFETAEKEADYRAWLEAKLTASLADRGPNIPHDQVMGEMDATISEAEANSRKTA